MDIAALLTPAPPPRSGPGLLSLPHELLAGIFDYVVAPLALLERSNLITRPHGGCSAAYEGDCKTARRTMLSACLVCRQLHRPAQESLYRNITLSSGQNIVHLLRTLLPSRCTDWAFNGGPPLPSLVRNIVCLAVLDDPDNNLAATITWDQILPDLVLDHIGTIILSALELYFPDEENRGASPFSTKHADWTIQRLFAAVLAFTPELRSLVLEDPSDMYSVLNACLAALQQRHELRGQILPKFTKISTRTDGRRHGIDSVLSSFLSLGTTTTYNAHYGAEPFDLRRHWQSPLPARLESVTMTCCVAPGRTLLTLIDSCSHLRHLHLDCLTWQHVDSEMFNNELPKLALTLKVLSLQGYYMARKTSRASATHYQQACSRLNCLPQMTNLAVLTINMSILVSSVTDIEIYGIARRLPPKLEHLTVYEEVGLFPADLAPIGRSLLQAAWDCPERLPRLRDFVYGREAVEDSGEENDSMQSEIRCRFASSGVNFRLEPRTIYVEYRSDGP